MKYIKVGKKIAIKVVLQSDNNNERFIVCEVVNINYRRNEIKCKDIDDASTVYCKKFSECVPLPTLIDVGIKQRKIFGKNEKVLSIYKTTTAFYPATVYSLPTNGNYKVVFDDDDDGSFPKTVPVQNVIPYDL